eukprot:1503911-Pyramimonas_sp.AAC.1
MWLPLSAAHIRRKQLHQLNVALAFTLRTVVRKVARLARMDGGSFSECVHRLSAAHVRLERVQEFYGLGTA